jgi:hypothetical protein
MVGKAHYELFTDKEKKIRFRLKAPNGKIICASEAYESTRNAKIGIASLQKFAGSEIQEDLR